jgi:caffeoyl-CoA O-methyltransferase
MPGISLQPDEARLLQVLITAIGAKKALEIGTLAGYSGTWIARALPEDGKLFTLEKSSKHARVARASFERAGLGERVTLLEGSALDSLPKLGSEAPFDFAFLDADQERYSDYFRWIDGYLRPGGILTAHNAFGHGRWETPGSPMDAFLTMLSQRPDYTSTIVSVGDGMLVAVKNR